MSALVDGPALLELYRAMNIRDYLGRLPSPLATWSLRSPPPSTSVALLVQVDPLPSRPDLVSTVAPATRFMPATISIAAGLDVAATAGALGDAMSALAKSLGVRVVRR